jgi:hypothetical protein
MMGPESEIAADKLTRFNEVMGWVRDYVKDGKFAAGTGDTFVLINIYFLFFLFQIFLANLSHFHWFIFRLHLEDWSYL